MADESRIKAKPVIGSAAAPVAAPASVASVSTAAPPVKWPEMSDSPLYRANHANLNRLKAEASRLEMLRQSYDALRTEHAKAQRSNVEEVLRGKTASQVRRDAPFVEADYLKIYEDLKLTRRAIEVAEKELLQIQGQAKEEACRPFAPAYRAKVRAAALAYIAAARAMGELDEINEHLANRELRDRGGLNSPLPAFPGGLPSYVHSDFAVVVRQLIDLGIVDEVKDAALLAGLAIAPKPVPYVEPAPKPPKEKPKKESALHRILRHAGALGDGWR